MKYLRHLLFGLSIIFQSGMATSEGGIVPRLNFAALRLGSEGDECLSDETRLALLAAAEQGDARARALSSAIELPPRLPLRVVAPKEYPKTEDEFLGFLYKILQELGIDNDCITAVKEPSDGEGRLLYSVTFNYGLYRERVKLDPGLTMLSGNPEAIRITKNIKDKIYTLAENTAVTVRVFIMESRVSPAKLSRGTSPSSDGRASTPSSGL